MGYLWGYSVGLKRRMSSNTPWAPISSATADETSRDWWNINEGPRERMGKSCAWVLTCSIPTGSQASLRAHGMQTPTGASVPTRDDLDSGLRLAGLLAGENRMSGNWSSRVAYALARLNDVGVAGTSAAGGICGLGRFESTRRLRAVGLRQPARFRHERQSRPWPGLGIGGIIRYCSGNPINETIGEDANGDRDNNDRPVAEIPTKITDFVRARRQRPSDPERIDGQGQTLVDLPVQYVKPMPKSQTVGFFWETYNVFNEIDYGNPTGNRNERNFMVPDEAGSRVRCSLGCATRSRAGGEHGARGARRPAPAVVCACLGGDPRQLDGVSTQDRFFCPNRSGTTSSAARSAVTGQLSGIVGSVDDLAGAHLPPGMPWAVVV